MIDLHCHLLPGIDDGSPDLDTSLAMARIAYDDGIRITACTPHIYPGLFENDAESILRAIETLQRELDASGIDLRLTCGADAHISPELLKRLREGTVPRLGHSRYFLLEPPHNVALPRITDYVFNLLAAGYVPVVTHPERLSWIDEHYPIFVELVRQGAWMQVTAGSLTGRFGPGPKYWGERMLDECLVHILATDAHSVSRRPPLLAEGQAVAERYLGAAEATHLVETRPAAILNDVAPSEVPALPNADAQPKRFSGGFLRKLFGFRPSGAR